LLAGLPVDAARCNDQPPFVASGMDAVGFAVPRDQGRRLDLAIAGGCPAKKQ